MMAITTSSSTNVKPRSRSVGRTILSVFDARNDGQDCPSHEFVGTHRGKVLKRIQFANLPLSTRCGQMSLRLKLERRSWYWSLVFVQYIDCMQTRSAEKRVSPH